MNNQRLTHDVHACQLRPNLGEYTDVGPPNHVGLDKLQEGNIGIIAFKFTHVFDFLKFPAYKGAVQVSLAVNKSQDSMAIFPTIFACKPTRRLWQEAHAQEEADGWDHLEAPGDTEGSGAIDKGTSVGYVEHNQDTPGDSPLLSTNKSATFRGGR